MLEKKTEKRSFAIHTLGCKVNTYESDAMSGALRRAGYEETDFSEPADVYIVNTCTVTNIADKKSRQMLHRAKKRNPGALVVAVGCYVDAAMQNEEMRAVLSDTAIDLLVPNRDKGRIAELITERLSKAEAEKTCAAGRNKGAWQEAAQSACEQPEPCTEEAAALPVCALPDAASDRGDAALFVTELDGHTRAFVKVQDGCNQFCSYCIIPYVRGRIRSRAVADCVEEIRRLSESGVKEVVLTGIHLSSYGKDWRKRTAEEAEAAVALSGRPESGTAGAEETQNTRESDDIVNTADAPLLALIRAVSKIEGIERIRLGSLEPRLMTEAFVSALSEIKKVCPHFHLSLQSGCAETLKRMNRHYTPEEFRQSCARIRAHYAHPAITTDVIVGFPGETEAEFAESREFLSEIGFYEMHVFQYSRRAGTRADRMEGQVPESVKEARSHDLLRLSEEMSHAFRAFYVGREVSLLCEEEISLNGVRYATGYTPEYVRCIKACGAFTRNAFLSGTVLEICKEKPVYECLLLR